MTKYMDRMTLNTKIDLADDSTVLMLPKGMYFLLQESKPLRGIIISAIKSFCTM